MATIEQVSQVSTVSTAPVGDSIDRTVDRTGSSALVSSALEQNFISLLPTQDRRIERVYWAFEKSILRIWTVIDRPDFDFEKKIYSAQLKFMEYFSDYTDMEFDFSVIYRYGKNVEDIRPVNATQVLPSAV